MHLITEYIEVNIGEMKSSDAAREATRRSALYPFQAIYKGTLLLSREAGVFLAESLANHHRNDPRLWLYVISDRAPSKSTCQVISVESGVILDKLSVNINDISDGAFWMTLVRGVKPNVRLIGRDLRQLNDFLSNDTRFHETLASYEELPVVPEHDRILAKKKRSKSPLVTAFVVTAAAVSCGLALYDYLNSAEPEESPDEALLRKTEHYAPFRKLLAEPSAGSILLEAKTRLERVLSIEGWTVDACNVSKTSLDCGLSPSENSSTKQLKAADFGTFFLKADKAIFTTSLNVPSTEHIHFVSVNPEETIHVLRDRISRKSVPASLSITKDPETIGSISRAFLTVSFSNSGTHDLINLVSAVDQLPVGIDSIKYDMAGGSAVITAHLYSYGVKHF